MELNDILPLLLKNSDPKMGAMISAMQGGDKSAIFNSVLGGDEKNKDMINMLSLMQKSKKGEQKNLVGFEHIFDFVPPKILGILVKHFKA
ncbi:MAG: hypothetical protein FWD86_02320 [Firmicutes bacterium]|nr:hypothetical protein [Bacillota bacterium]